MNKKNGHEEMTADDAMEQAAIHVERMIEAANEEGEDLAPRLERIFALMVRLVRKNHQAIGLSESESESKIKEMEESMAKTLEVVREDDRDRGKSS